jgi:hypothetical protein
MSYIGGEEPRKGDHVKRENSGRTGLITWVQLSYPSTPGHDAVSVNFDDGAVRHYLKRASRCDLKNQKRNQDDQILSLGE